MFWFSTLYTSSTMFLIFSCLYGTRGENNIFQQFYYGRERHLGRHDRRRRYKPVRRENAVYRFLFLGQRYDQLMVE